LYLKKDRAQVSLLNFAETAQVEWDLDDYEKNDAQDAELVVLKAAAILGGKTNIFQALFLAMIGIFQPRYKLPGAGNRFKVPDLVILVSDGTPTTVVADITVPMATIVKNAGIPIMGVGSGSANVPKLTEIASPGLVFTAPTVAALYSETSNILDGICTAGKHICTR
jgi:uncharacterized protein YegL